MRSYSIEITAIIGLLVSAAAPIACTATNGPGGGEDARAREDAAVYICSDPGPPGDASEDFKQKWAEVCNGEAPQDGDGNQQDSSDGEAVSSNGSDDGGDSTGSDSSDDYY
jgi:hypothetical protein